MRRGPSGGRLADTEAWKQEALPWAEVASEGQAADEATDLGRGIPACSGLICHLTAG